MKHPNELENGAPPAKRLKLQTVADNICKTDENNNIENTVQEPVVLPKKSETRKRKIAVRRSQQSILDLNVDVILDIIDYLSLGG